MPLLIDGYNLLHVTGLVGRGPGLHGSREALLRFLAAAVEPRELPRTTIVFDAADAPPSLPNTITFAEMTVHFASNYDDADELIEELIEASHTPRSLLVVSSDHRIQRAAQRRRAPFVDSDVWFAEALRKRDRSRPATSPIASKPIGQLTEGEVAYWLNEFGPIPDQPIEPPPRRRSEIKKDTPTAASRARPEHNGKKRKRKPSTPPVQPPRGLENPFPPGYGEDLLQ
jgi:predicted RNA-binding protein with PIN domain